MCGGPPICVRPEDAPAATTRDDLLFRDVVQPLLKQFCVRCHNADKTKGGVRVDQLSALPDERQFGVWKKILKQTADEAMPPDDEPQPTEQDRKTFAEWVQRTMTAALKRNNRATGRCGG